MLPLPDVGLGTYKMTENEIKEIVPFAIKNCSYRLIDTANCYKNEKYIGDAIQQIFNSKYISRQEIFITSKLSTFASLM